MSEEEIEIFKNLIEYMQNSIDNGYNKFIYNDLDWDFKCIDCINALNTAMELQKELEQEKEKSKEYKQRLIFTENKSFNRKQYYKENFISKDKIREKINYIESTYSQINGNYFMMQNTIDTLKELLED